MIGQRGDGAGRHLEIERAGGVGEDRDPRAEQSAEADREDHLCRLEALVAVDAAAKVEDDAIVAGAHQLDRQAMPGDGADGEGEEARERQRVDQGLAEIDVERRAGHQHDVGSRPAPGVPGRDLDHELGGERVHGAALYGVSCPRRTASAPPILGARCAPTATSSAALAPVVLEPARASGARAALRAIVAA